MERAQPHPRRLPARLGTDLLDLPGERDERALSSAARASESASSSRDLAQLPVALDDALSEAAVTSPGR